MRRKVATLYAPARAADVGHDPALVELAAETICAGLAVMGLEVVPTWRVRNWNRVRRFRERKEQEK